MRRGRPTLWREIERVFVLEHEHVFAVELNALAGEELGFSFIVALGELAATISLEFGHGAVLGTEVDGDGLVCGRGGCVQPHADLSEFARRTEVSGSPSNMTYK